MSDSRHGEENVQSDLEPLIVPKCKEVLEKEKERICVRGPWELTEGVPSGKKIKQYRFMSQDRK